MEATKRGHKNIVKVLLERKADTNVTNKVGWYLDIILCHAKVQAISVAEYYNVIL